MLHSSSTFMAYTRQLATSKFRKRWQHYLFVKWKSRFIYCEASAFCARCLTFCCSKKGIILHFLAFLENAYVDVRLKLSKVLQLYEDGYKLLPNKLQFCKYLSYVKKYAETICTQQCCKQYLKLDLYLHSNIQIENYANL